MLVAALVSFSGIGIQGNDTVETWLRIALVTIGKFSVTTSLAMLYVYSGEIFPTVSEVPHNLILFKNFLALETHVTD